MIRAIVFDFGGVVVPGVLLQQAKKLASDDPRFLRFQEKSKQWDLGLLTVEQFYEALADFMELEKATIEKEFYGRATANEEVVALIRKLKKHYTIILFSDNFAHNVRKYFEVLRLDDVFDTLVISSDHGMKKPDHAFFQKMLDISGFAKDEVIFIDDTQKNVDEANTFGIHTLLFTSAEKLKEDLQNLSIQI